MFGLLCVVSTLGTIGMLRHPDTHEDAYLLCVFSLLCGLAFLLTGGPVITVAL